jgi:hypothetical protein
VTNQTGIDKRGTSTRVILKRALNGNLVALFSPEHGIDGTVPAGKYVSSRKDKLTGLTVHSLYGPTRKPTSAMLKGIDVLVYDMQTSASAATRTSRRWRNAWKPLVKRELNSSCSTARIRLAGCGWKVRESRAGGLASSAFSQPRMFTA